MSYGFKLPFIPKDAPIYEARQDSKGEWYVNGPGGGEFGYDGGFMYPSSRFKWEDTEAKWIIVERHAQTAAMLTNKAFAEGYAQAQMDIRLALGL